MWIRCPNCGRSTRAAFDISRGVTCILCGRYSSLERAKQLGATPKERFRRANGFAREQRIDLASAYSVLLGIIPLSKALSIPSGDTPPSNAPSVPAGHTYDPCFRKAVESGFLTEQQAIERGDRVLYASTLALHHNLGMKAAFLISDNRMQLTKATATRAVWVPAATVGAIVVIAATLVAMIPSRPAPASLANAAAAEPTLPAKPVFETDSEGLVTRVSGPDPKTVLVALCAHQQFAENLTPVALARTVPPSPGDRLGLVRDVRDLSARRCVVIHQNSNTGLWFAGDGRNPIEFETAP